MPAPKTFILRRRGRLLVVFIAIAVMILAVFSPAVIGVGMMALEESHTGITQNEVNSIWGVLPWPSMFTVVIFMLVAALTVLVSALVKVCDAVVLWRTQ